MQVYVALEGLTHQRYFGDVKKLIEPTPVLVAVR